MEYLEASLEKIEHVYLNFMKDDFPEDELKSLDQIKALYHANHFIMYLAIKDKEIVGYACFVSVTEKSNLLDYFAVTSSIRGQGIGSEILQWILSENSSKCLMIECETPEMAKTEAERKLREKRISFYLQQGILKTKIQTCIIGVPYTVLRNANDAYTEYDTRAMLTHLYKTLTPNLEINMNEEC